MWNITLAIVYVSKEARQSEQVIDHHVLFKFFNNKNLKRIPVTECLISVQVSLVFVFRLR